MHINGNKKWKIWLFFIIIVFTIITLSILYKSSDKPATIPQKENPNSRHFKHDHALKNKFLRSNRRNTVVWQDAPNLTVICRAYKGSIMEFYNVFLIGYHLFWPQNQWPTSDLVVVLDDESELDHRMATVLGNVPPFPKIFFEKIPDEETFCPEDRRIGYSRQQYSNFYSDLYTEKEYIGIVDSDSVFVTHVVPENLFVDGKPRIYGYNGCCTGWQKSLPEAIGGDYNIGEFMVVIGFPVMIKREHFRLMRDHITKRMKAANFEQAFHKICSKYPKKYSQFDLMVHFLWFNKRDEYSWHLNDWRYSKHPSFSRLMTFKDEVLEVNRPIQGVMKHGNHHVFSDYIFKLMGDYLCVASKNQAGSCEKFFSDELFEGTYRNLFVDWQFKTADWEKRGMEQKPDFKENPWTLPDKTYNDTYNAYIKFLIDRKISIQNQNDSSLWFNKFI